SSKASDALWKTWPRQSCCAGNYPGTRHRPEPTWADFLPSQVPVQRRFFAGAAQVRAMRQVALVLTAVMMTVSLALLQSGCAGGSNGSGDQSSGGTTTPPPPNPNPTPTPGGSLQSINHIIFIAQ